MKREDIEKYAEQIKEVYPFLWNSEYAEFLEEFVIELHGMYERCVELEFIDESF